ncbi:MAG: ATP-grasp domain-containing protein, partial [Elusimicrobia bacterium]|nr:ATP-grasp domain-containing protein [Elusimicrobiota bacterium]
GQGSDKEIKENIFSLTPHPSPLTPSLKKKVIVLGSGPNRIGQGIEFDYVCVHAVEAIREEGMEAIMINSNPETVSTDYDTADRLYFEPVCLEEVANVARRESDNLLGLILGFGGQTPLNMAHELVRAMGKKAILGTAVEDIDISEDRKKFGQFLTKLRVAHPNWIMIRDLGEARRSLGDRRRSIRFPVLVRPSYILGGRGVRVFYDAASLQEYLESLHWPKDKKGMEIYVDEFLEDALELDVDVVGDGRNFAICGVMEHIEEAGIHSGDSSCVWPAATLRAGQMQEVEKTSLAIARGLKIKGLLNIQYAICRDSLFVLEANPRASRTIPFISKARGIPWAKIAAKACLGRPLAELLAPYRERLEAPAEICAVKTPVFSWDRFTGADLILGPEMRSTGEIMTIGRTFVEAFSKAHKVYSGEPAQPSKGVLFSLKNEDKPKFLSLAKRFSELGFKIVATKNTAGYFRDHGGLEVQEVFKLGEGRPHVVDVIVNAEVCLAVNTPSHQAKARSDGYEIRSQALWHQIPIISTPRALEAMLQVAGRPTAGIEIYPLQDIVGPVKNSRGAGAKTPAANGKKDFSAKVPEKKVS